MCGADDDTRHVQCLLRPGLDVLMPRRSGCPSVVAGAVVGGGVGNGGIPAWCVLGSLGRCVSVFGQSSWSLPSASAGLLVFGFLHFCQWPFRGESVGLWISVSERFCSSRSFEVLLFQWSRSGCSSRFKKV